MALAVHHIPYKRVSRCGIEELAAEQAARDRRESRLTGGVSFARRESDEGKTLARNEVRRLFSLLPDREISALTMPGMAWSLEVDVLNARDPRWTKTGVRRTRFTCVENDRFVYYSAVTRMLGNRHGALLRNLDRPAYAECAIGNGVIDRFEFANVDDLMAEGRESFDIAWLDYTGPLTVQRLEIIERFYRERVRSILIVTSLKARWNSEVERAAKPHGGYCEWAVSPFHNEIGLHAIEYYDGSPMFQFACRKA